MNSQCALCMHIRVDEKDWQMLLILRTNLYFQLPGGRKWQIRAFLVRKNRIFGFDAILKSFPESSIGNLFFCFLLGLPYYSPAIQSKLYLLDWLQVYLYTFHWVVKRKTSFNWNLSRLFSINFENWFAMAFFHSFSSLCKSFALEFLLFRLSFMLLYHRIDVIMVLSFLLDGESLE